NTSGKPNKRSKTPEVIISFLIHRASVLYITQLLVRASSINYLVASRRRIAVLLLGVWDEEITRCAIVLWNWFTERLALTLSSQFAAAFPRLSLSHPSSGLASLAQLMATKPLTHEEIANTEKKLDMPLDDIIKLSKTSTTKPNKQRRAPNKNQRLFNNSVQEKALKVQRYMASRPFVRQGALAQKRSNFQGNHFPIAKEFAQKAAVAPLRNRPFERNVMSNPNKAR
ncbi:unnamed protein product, partial [Linum tenue]